MSFAFRATAIAVACFSLHSRADADEFTAATTSPRKLEEIVVTGNPLKGKDAMAPVSVLKEEELLVRRASTLGETLSGVPGVASTFFGPNASRPIIRGLDGDRIRVLNNSSASFDASNVSFDHNPAVDPLAIDRIEVLRGPAALLYGGTAIGGVVNVIDNRVAREPLTGVGGALELRVGGAERENGASALLDAGQGTYAVHADGFTRDTGDYAVPASAGLGRRIRNSASHSKGGALGGTLHFADGYLGVTQSDTQMRYGTVAEPDVTIEMQQRRTGIESEIRAAGWLETASLKVWRTRYEHVELEGGATGTTFGSTGRDLRLELRHRELGPFKGVLGMQAERFDFSALGEEAFLPRTDSRLSALFVFEEIAQGNWRFNAGARAEKGRVDSAGSNGAATARFGAADRRIFNATSFSMGAQWKSSPRLSWNASVSRSQRAPAFYELFANGPHVATAAFEVGDRNLEAERATAFDAGFTRQLADDGKTSLRIGAFMNQFANFIALRRTGVLRDASGQLGALDCGDGTSVQSQCVSKILPEFAYQGVRARLSGVEAELNWRVWGAKDMNTLDLEFKADVTRATDLTHAEPLPRIAPLRLKAAGIWSAGPWTTRLDIDHADRQGRVPRDDALGPTPSHTLVHAAVSYKWSHGATNALLFLKAGNLGNQAAYNASSIDTIRSLAPLLGRAVKAGIQFTF